MIRPEDYPDREAWIGALIAQADELNRQAQALPPIPDPPKFYWEV